MIKFAKLEDVCNVRRGTTITKKQTKKGNVPVIAGGRKAAYYHNKHNRESGAITISGSGASAGLVNYWQMPIFASDCSTVEPKDDKQNRKFIYYYLQSMQEFIYKNLRSGAAQPHVYAKEIGKLNFPLISLQEQQLIIAKLDAAFAGIDRAITSTRKSLTSSIDIFENFTKSIFLENKFKVKLVFLKDISEYFNGLTYSPKDVSSLGTIVLRASNIQKGNMKYKDIVRVKKKIKDKLYVKPTDILICSRNGSKRLIGKSSVIGEYKEQMTFGTFMMIVRSEYNYYLQWFFKSSLFKKQISGGEQTMINQITRYMLDEVKVPLPNKAILEDVSVQFTEISNNIQKLEKIYEDKSEQFSKLKYSILRQEMESKVLA